MRFRIATWLVCAVLASNAFGVGPDLLNVGPEESMGPGRLPAIAVDSLNQPHVVTDGGSMVHMYDRIGGQWRSLSKDVRPLVNAPQFYNPHIEIDSQDRAWISGVTWAPAGGVGVILRENMTTNPTDFGRFPLSRAGARYPVGLLSIDPAFPNEAIVMGTAGGWQRVVYDASRAERVRLTDTGNLPKGAGGEKTAFWISKAGSVPHPGGRTQGIWHAAMGGYYGDYSAYINSLMQARGQGRRVWANYPSYPSMKDDGAYVRVVSDNLEPEVAYITCDFTAGGRRPGTGIGMNIYNGNGFNFPPNNILILDNRGTAGLRRFAPQSAPALDGGAFVTWNRDGRVKMRYVPATARSISELGPEWDLGVGGPAAIAVDADGDVHLAYTRGGQTFYRLLTMSGSSRVSHFAVDFTGDGRDDPAEFNAAQGRLFIIPGTVGFGQNIQLPFVQSGDIPVFANYDGNAGNGVEVGVFRPSNGRWLIYRGNIFAPYNPALLEQFNWGRAGDIPFAGDFNGSGFAEVGVFRPEEGKWFLRQGIASAPGFAPQDFIFGATNGIPMVGRWNSDRDDIVIWHPDTKTFNMYARTFPGGASTIQFGNVLGEDMPVPADYDGDGRLDVAVFRPETAEWFVMPSGGGSMMSVQWGSIGDTPVPGRYTYDARADIAVLRNNQMFIAPSEPGQPIPFGRAPFSFGGPNFVPVPADYDNNGRANIAVFDTLSANWHVFPYAPVVFGGLGDTPAPADFDGDGYANLAVFRPNTAQWFIASTNGLRSEVWGQPGDVPVPADYDGDGRADVGVYRNGLWYVFGTTDGFISEAFGTTGWQPIPWTYTTGPGGRAQLGIFNRATATWQIPGSSTFSWGPGGGIAVPADYTGNGELNLAVYQQGWWWIRRDDGSMWHGRGPIDLPGSGAVIGAR